MDQPKLTIMIPTKNRSDLLIRLLKYFAKVGCPYNILIGDSSSPEHVAQARQFIQSVQGNLNVIYQEYPHLNDSASIKQLIDLVQTPYAVFVADDDFLIPNGLARCVQFLETHPDYSAIHGKAIQFHLPDEVHPQCRTGYYSQPVIEGETATKRLSQLCQRYLVTLFSVHRTAVWKAMYANVTELTDKSFTEILPCFLTVVYGKVKELDCFYLVRQHHGRRYTLPDYYDWISSMQWPVSHEIFSRSLAKELANQDGLSKEKAQYIIKQMFWLHLGRGLNYVLQKDYGIGFLLPKTKIKIALNRFPFLAERLLPIWQRIAKGPFSLPALLDRHSPYHVDFLPVYKAFTEIEYTFSKISNIALQSNKENIVVRVYGDSLSLPRAGRGIGYDIIYPETIRQWMESIRVDCRVYFFNRSQGGKNIEALFEEFQTDSDYFGEEGEKILIIQCGIVDCAPRPIPAVIKNNILAKMSVSVRAPIVSFIHNHRARLLKMGFQWRATSPKRFKNIYIEWLGRAHSKFNRIYVFNILPTTELVGKHSPGLTASIDYFNRLIEEVLMSIGAKNIFLLDVNRVVKQKHFPLEKYIDAEDGHHLTIEGHQLLSEMVIQHEKFFVNPKDAVLKS